jgi:GH15 family glucan-1,4-alpha-glucosidase
MTPETLARKSIDLIINAQSPSGAWMACDSFPQYRFSWLRDGAFIAYAMLLHGHPESCRSFLLWGARVLTRHAQKVAALADGLAAGITPDRSAFLPTRYTLEGAACNDDWPNHQIDGYGAWLWCLARYEQDTGDASLRAEALPAIETVVKYLTLTWRLPCYDCWEENPTGIHPSTLACVHGGLQAMNAFLGRPEIARECEAIRGFVAGNCAPYGGFPKSIGREDVDASLLWLALPFGLMDLADPRMTATAAEIEKTLYEKGGVKRYATDTYYGGGQWVLLSAWLGWYHARTGDGTIATDCLHWVMGQCDEEGHLPEQSLRITNDPAFISPWERKWGKVATPLLWSHAMFLILWDALGERQGSQSKQRSRT